MSTPRVAAIHDMSGFGRCSLTVAIPILSAMGIQCCPLPTAFLSTHTGGFEGFTFLDMTDELPKVAAHWKEYTSRFVLLMKQLVLRLSKGKYRLPEILRRRNFRKFYDLQMKLICLNKSTQRRRNRKRGTPLATTRRFPSHRNC